MAMKVYQPEMLKPIVHNHGTEFALSDYVEVRIAPVGVVGEELIKCRPTRRFAPKRALPNIEKVSL